MKKPTLRILTASAMFAALIFAATCFIKIPLPVGYVHAGDGLVFLAAAFLPLPYAMAASAIGMGLCDLVLGYTLWIPATVLTRVLATLIFSRKGKTCSLHNVIAALVSVLIITAGYWAYEAIFYYHSAVGALAGVPLNLAQSALGAAIFIAVAKIADRMNATKKLERH
jgi:uncharacterized repeat protein (TIGR04002 family)